MSDFGNRLIHRLEEARDRNTQVLVKNQTAKGKLERALTTLSKNLKGNEIVLIAMREVYGVLEADGEQLQATIIELKEAKDSLEMAVSLLEQAGLDMVHIQTFSKEEVWLAEHLPTIRRALDIFNLSKLEQALIESERFDELDKVFEQAKQKRHAK